MQAELWLVLSRNMVAHQEWWAGLFHSPPLVGGYSRIGPQLSSRIYSFALYLTLLSTLFKESSINYNIYQTFNIKSTIIITAHIICAVILRYLLIIRAINPNINNCIFTYNSTWINYNLTNSHLIMLRNLNYVVYFKNYKLSSNYTSIYAGPLPCVVVNNDQFVVICLNIPSHWTLLTK